MRRFYWTHRGLIPGGVRISIVEAPDLTAAKVLLEESRVGRVHDLYTGELLQMLLDVTPGTVIDLMRDGPPSAQDNRYAKDHD